jgi:translation initiation factor 2 alpha subunit (eIF-2alpha)
VLVIKFEDDTVALFIYTLAKMKYYNSSLPTLHSTVSIRIDAYEDYGVSVTLLEYDLKGMIFSRELAKKRIKSFKDVVRIGEEMAADVIDVDEAKGNINLSIRSVSEEEREMAAKTHAQHRLVNDVVVRVATAVGCEVSELYERLVWPLEETDTGAYNALVSCNDPDANAAEVLLGVYVDEFVKAIRLRMPAPSFTEVREVRLVSTDCLMAPERLTAALNAACECGASVWILGPPMYKFSMTDVNEARAKERMDVACAAAAECVKV